MNADRHFDAIVELWAGLYFVLNALFYHYLVQAFVWIFAPTKRLRPDTIMKMRIASAVLAVAVTCKGLYDLGQT